MGQDFPFLSDIASLLLHDEQQLSLLQPLKFIRQFTQMERSLCEAIFSAHCHARDLQFQSTFYRGANAMQFPAEQNSVGFVDRRKRSEDGNAPSERRQFSDGHRSDRPEVDELA